MIFGVRVDEVRKKSNYIMLRNKNDIVPSRHGDLLTSSLKKYGLYKRLITNYLYFCVP